LIQIIGAGGKKRVIARYRGHRLLAGTWLALTTLSAMRKEDTMSTNRIEGAAKEAGGSIKETAGKMTGNDKLRAKGAVEKAVGTAQNAVGRAQDKFAHTLKK